MFILSVNNRAQDSKSFTFRSDIGNNKDVHEGSILYYPHFLVDLYLYDENLYIFEATCWVTNDIIAKYKISYGTYKSNKQFIELHDRNNGYDMLLQVEGEDVKFIKSFILFSNIVLFNDGYCGTMSEEDKDIFNKTSSIRQVKQRRKQFLVRNNKPNDFSPGKYSIKEGWGVNSIEFKIDSTYTMELEHLILSEGKWTRKGNELTLHDTALDFDFHVLIGKNELISMKIPTDVKGITFVREKPE